MATGATCFALCIWTAFNIWALAYNGVNYIHSSLLSIIFALVYLGVIIYIDDELMDFCEKLGFNQRKSRYYKFYTLFASMLLFIFVTILCSGIRDTWV